MWRCISTILWFACFWACRAIAIAMFRVRRGLLWSWTALRAAVRSAGAPSYVRRAMGALAGAALASSVQVDFDEPMDPASFSIADDVLGFTGPAGSIAVTGHNWIDADTLELTFDPINVDGYYAPHLKSGILDMPGQPLDQNNNEIGGESQDGYMADLTGSVKIGGRKVAPAAPGDRVGQGIQGHSIADLRRRINAPVPALGASSVVQSAIRNPQWNHPQSPPYDSVGRILARGASCQTGS